MYSVMIEPKELELMKRKRAESINRKGAQLLKPVSISVFLIAVIFAVLVAYSSSPANRFTGRWSGTLFQAPGGITSSYIYTMTIVERDGHLDGASTISDDAYDGTLLFDATISGDALKFQDTKIITSDLPDSYLWCIKTGTLKLSPDGSTLSGSWTGENGCAPGTIRLQRNPD